MSSSRPAIQQPSMEAAVANALRSARPRGGGASGTGLVSGTACGGRGGRVPVRQGRLPTGVVSGGGGGGE